MFGSKSDINVDADSSNPLSDSASFIPEKKSWYDLKVLSGNRLKTTGTADVGPTEACKIKTWYHG